MDMSVLPNNNHPHKFLQLDARTLPATHGTFQVGSETSSPRHWLNRVYVPQTWTEEQVRGTLLCPQREHRTKSEDRVVFVDRYLEKHITPFTLKCNMKRNPLFSDVRSTDTTDKDKSKPCWTVRDLDTQTTHGNLSSYLKQEEKTPTDVDFWLQDLYTPGFDSLLKKTEAEDRRKKLCRIIVSTLLCVCATLVVIIVPVVVLKNKT